MSRKRCRTTQTNSRALTFEGGLSFHTTRLTPSPCRTCACGLFPRVDKRCQKASEDTTRIDRNKWSLLLVDSDWSALCQTLYGGGEQEDWSPCTTLCGRRRRMWASRRFGERTRLLWKLREKKGAGSTKIRDPVQIHNAGAEGLARGMGGVSSRCKEDGEGGAEGRSTCCSFGKKRKPPTE